MGFLIMQKAFHAPGKGLSLLVAIWTMKSTLEEQFSSETKTVLKNCTLFFKEKLIEWKEVKEKVTN